MASATEGHSIRQEPNPADEGDHAVDSAFRFRDNKVVSATADAKTKITDRKPSNTSSEMAELAAQAEREVRRDGGYGDGPDITDLGDQPRSCAGLS